jgi:hypothetical protein
MNLPPKSHHISEYDEVARSLMPMSQQQSVLASNRFVSPSAVLKQTHEAMKQYKQIIEKELEDHQNNSL